MVKSPPCGNTQSKDKRTGLPRGSRLIIEHRPSIKNSHRQPQHILSSYSRTWDTRFVPMIPTCNLDHRHPPSRRNSSHPRRNQTGNIKLSHEQNLLGKLFTTTLTVRGRCRFFQTHHEGGIRAADTQSTGTAAWSLSTSSSVYVASIWTSLPPRQWLWCTRASRWLAGMTENSRGCG